jgi:hypothetical protein
MRGVCAPYSSRWRAAEAALSTGGSGGLTAPEDYGVLNGLLTRS